MNPYWGTARERISDATTAEVAGRLAEARRVWPTPGATTQPYWFPLPALPGAPAPLESLVQGEVVETAHGAFFLRRAILPLDEYYGPCRLGDFLHVQPSAAAALARLPELRDATPESALFLDTETTGLSGGTGTYAFLVGLGSFRQVDGQAAFVIEQACMRSYTEERAMLDWLHLRLREHETLVTFNGRVFDAPLLETRFRMSRMRVNLEEWLHFDMLPPARRLWRPSVQSCALQSLERHILRVGREADIESFLIPAIYHQYVRDGDGRYLERVFNHNRADILATVALAIRACGIVHFGAGMATVTGASAGTDAGAVSRVGAGTGADAATGTSPSSGAGSAIGPGLAADADGSTGVAGAFGQGASIPIEVSPAEFCGLGRVYEQQGDLDAAERAYRAALAGPPGQLPRDLRYRTLLVVADLLKRQRRHDAAAELWQVVVDEAPVHSVSALVELAKYWEHRRRDPRMALTLAELARDRWLAGLPAAERPLPGLERARVGVPASPPDDFARRLTRLTRKHAAVMAAVPASSVTLDDMGDG